MTLRNVEISAVTTKEKGRVSISYSGAHTKGAIWEVTTFPANLAEDSRNELRAIKETTDAGGVVKAAVEILKEGKFWELKQVTKPVKEEVKTYNKSSYQQKDDVGIKVGAARNQAIAFLSATKGANFTLDDVDKTAYEIVTRQAAQEQNVRNGAPTEALLEEKEAVPEAQVAEQTATTDW